MLLIPCPYCGQRPEIEFRYGGEAHVVRHREPWTITDQDWTDYLYVRKNPKGWHAERWRHSHGCGRFFNLIRETVGDRILVAYRCGEAQPQVPLGTAT